MSRTSALLALLALPAALALPATASATDYCVNNAACVAAGGVNEGSDGAALQAALDAAKAHANVGGADRVLIGAGTYSRTMNNGNPAFTYNGDAVTIQGAGAGTTTLTRDIVNSSTVLFASTGATVRDLTVRIPGGTGISGLGLTSATADGVTITAANGTATTTGVDINNAGVFKNGSANLSVGTGASLSPGATITDSTVGGTFAIQASGGAVTIRRCRVFVGGFGVLAYYADLTIEDTLFDLGGGGGTAVMSTGNVNGNATATLRHLTIVHGSAASQGVSVQANGGHTSTATLADSVIDGVGHPLDLEGDGAGSAVSLTTHYSLAPLAALVKTNTNGAPVPTLTTNNAITAAPGFVSSAGDWHLRYDSPLIDAGTPGALGPSESPTDLDGLARMVKARRDVGAFEYQRRAPVVTASASAGTAVTGEALTFTGSATDADPGDVVAPYQWTFDDGAVVPAGTAATHAFATAGIHTATLTATDSAGVTGTAAVTVTIGEPPAPPAGTPGSDGSGAGDGGTPSPSGEATGPSPSSGPATPGKIVTLAMAPAGLRRGQRGRVTYRLSAPATVVFRLERKARGHRRGGRCRATGRGRACTRWVAVRGSVKHEGKAGTNRLRLPARFGGRKLSPGTYRLVARAGDGKPVRIFFRVLR